jgi:hypothetical protein
MRQHSFAVSIRRVMDTSAGKVESQYLVGALSPCRHSMSNRSSSCGCQRH